MRKIPRIDSPFLLAPEALPRRPGGPADWAQVFGGDRRLRIEIGVGNSPFLIEVASLEPDFSYLGFEYSGKRVLKFLKQVHRAGLDNIRMLRLNAAQVLVELVPPASVNHFFLNFPDPWPKRRHARKRFVCDRTAELVSRLLEPGGGLSLRTDAPAYAEEMLQVLDRAAALSNLSGAGHFADMPLYPFPTPYELRFRQEGRRIYYLEYRRA